MVVHPRHRILPTVSYLVSTFGNAIKDRIDGDHRLRSTTACEICQADGVLLLVPSTESKHLSAGRQLTATVDIELRACIGRDPFKLVSPSHASLECVDLFQRCRRNKNKCSIALCEMQGNTLELIGEERATTAAFFVIAAEHEMINRKLALSAEELLERLPSLISIKGVRLVNF